MKLTCPSLHQRPSAVALGNSFGLHFANRTARLGKDEIPLFQAMQEALIAAATPPQAYVEEYHGSNHQVTFAGSGAYSRAKARCELSDLLVIAFDRRTKDARLSYIQAKSERVVPANATRVAGRLLAANLEQWDLLANRPLIDGVRSFKPPRDLLKSAMLDSVGSFAFFLHGPGGVDIQYSAALDLQQRSTSRYGKLVAPIDTCRCGPFPECRSVYGSADFGAFLFGLMIGTPILDRRRPVPWSASTWLASQLRGFPKRQDRDGPIATELADLLDPDRSSAAESPNVGAASLILFGLGSDIEAS